MIDQQYELFDRMTLFHYQHIELYNNLIEQMYYRVIEHIQYNMTCDVNNEQRNWTNERELSESLDDKLYRWMLDDIIKF